MKVKREILFRKSNYLIHFLLFLIICNSVSAQKQGIEKLDSLLSFLHENPKNDTPKVRLLLDITSEYLFIEPQKGLDYAKQALVLANSFHNELLQCECYKLIAVNYGYLSDFENELNYQNKAISLYEKNNKTDEVAGCLLNIGITYNKQSNYLKALEYYFKALKKFEETKNNKGLALCYGNIGVVYLMQEDAVKSIFYIKKALAIDLKLNNKEGIARNFMNLGNNFRTKKMYFQSLDNYNNALKIAVELGNNILIARIYANIGSIFNYIGNYDESYTYYEKSLSISDKTDDLYTTANCLSGLGELFLTVCEKDVNLSNFKHFESFTKNNLLQQSVDKLTKAIEIFKNIQDNEDIIYCYKDVCTAYLKLGNWEMSYYYNDSAYQLQDSVFSAKNQIAFAHLESKRESEVRDKEIEILKSKDRQQKIALLAVFAGFLLVSVIALLVLRSLRIKRKTNDLLNEKNHLITQQNDLLENSHKTIKEDIDQAKEYVLSLLPEKLSKGKIKTDWLFIPSSNLGGDAFGYHWIDCDNFAFYILDVCGHGIGSALHSVSVLHTIRSRQQFKIDLRKPELVISLLNNIYQMEDHGGLFFSIWYGVLNFNENTLTYVCAGHPAPMLKTPNDEFHLLEQQGIMIGCIEEFTFAPKTIQIENGSTIYLFSDGVFELLKPNGDLFNVNEFYEMLKNSSNHKENELENIYSNLSNIQKSNRFDDDFSVLKICFSST